MKKTMTMIVLATAVSIGAATGGITHALWGDSSELGESGNFPTLQVSYTSDSTGVTTQYGTGGLWDRGSAIDMSTTELEQLARGEKVYKSVTVDYVLQGRYSWGQFFTVGELVTDSWGDTRPDPNGHMGLGRGWEVTADAPCDASGESASQYAPTLEESVNNEYRDYTTPKTKTFCVALRKDGAYSIPTYTNTASVTTDQGVTASDSWSTNVYPEDIYNKKLLVSLQYVPCTS